VGSLTWSEAGTLAARELNLRFPNLVMYEVGTVGRVGMFTSYSAAPMIRHLSHHPGQGAVVDP
jgi:hypothetical protein